MPECAIIEFDIERDRKTCISLDARVAGANRELAQWLMDHPRYTGETVAGWLGCGPSRIKDLRTWAKEGFEKTPTQKRKERANYFTGSELAGRSSGQQVLKSQENFGEEDLVEDPRQVMSTMLETISRQKAIAESYRKICKVSSFDPETEVRLNKAIVGLISKWRSIQATLTAKGSSNESS